MGPRGVKLVTFTLLNLAGQEKSPIDWNCNNGGVSEALTPCRCNSTSRVKVVLSGRTESQCEWKPSGLSGLLMAFSVSSGRSDSQPRCPSPLIWTGRCCHLLGFHPSMLASPQVRSQRPHHQWELHPHSPHAHNTSYNNNFLLRY